MAAEVTRYRNAQVLVWQHLETTAFCKWLVIRYDLITLKA
jgi:hypothetical protein